ncbi:AAA family ATPase [Pseudomonas haemolytica]|uniref:AAA family ATPase n=1 Tax=Pseudomonas haemolytica TaxID=2600065 RepID=A0A646NXL7_9PSED|nr:MULTISPECIES: AAA family ATPase [Pseudomonas]MBJ2286995.1 AAA family ATPase [Pseudomonas sp. MF6755]MRJ20921.1 AAA family ATPase [Pseudomonas haemolytica]
MQINKLIAVKTGANKFEFENPESLKWNGFFDVDTIRLILGNNGSGKTALLCDIASCISSPRSLDRREVYDARKPSSEKLSDQELEGIGVIYFSPVPYRRRLPLRHRFFDASPQFGKVENFGRVEQFYQVASDLALNSRLRAEVGYEFELFKTILVPSLISMSRVNGFATDASVMKFLSDYDKIEKRRKSVSSNYYESERLSSRIEGLLDTCVLRLEHHVCSKLPTDQERVVLAALTEVTKKVIDPHRVGRFFFNFYGLVHDPSYKKDEELFELLNVTYRTTRNYISARQEGGVRTHPRSYSFAIRSAKEAKDIKKTKAAVEVRWTDQSSGVRALVDQFFLLRRAFATMARKKFNHVLVLIDEGDAYLHLEWQRKYISLLNKFLATVKSEFGMDIVQVVIATHSPVIAGDFPACMVTNLDEKITPQNTFAAPLEDIILNSFGTTAIGEFAANKINELNERLERGDVSALDMLVLESIGDIGIKEALYPAPERPGQ